MGSKLSFSIPGLPKGKGRARLIPGTTRLVPDKATVAHEKAIRDIFKLKFPRHEPFTGPVMVRITAIFPMPKAFTAAQHAAGLAGQMFFTGKPDKDNIEKLVYDALNGVAWLDDAQCSGGCMKRYGTPPRIDVTIEELEQAVPSLADRRRQKKAAQPELVMGRRVIRR